MFKDLKEGTVAHAEIMKKMILGAGRSKARPYRNLDLCRP